MAHDIFTSYPSEDKNVANAVCSRLETLGVRCWIAPRDAITKPLEMHIDELVAVSNNLKHNGKTDTTNQTHQPPPLQPQR